MSTPGNQALEQFQAIQQLGAQGAAPGGASGAAGAGGAGAGQPLGNLDALQQLATGIQSGAGGGGDDGSGMGFGTIMLILFFSLVGIVYFRYGKKAGSMLFLIVGVALMVYPYFVSDPAYSIGVGVALSAAPFLSFIRR